MTMYQFMVNAFYMLCGVACVAASVVIVYIEEHHSKPAGFGMALSAALVSYAVVNGRKCGRTTDYMKDGKGYPLNYCPSCGKRVKNE